MMGRTGSCQILHFQELYGAESSFINVILFLATVGVLKEIIKNNLLFEVKFHELFDVHPGKLAG